MENTGTAAHGGWSTRCVGGPKEGQAVGNSREERVTFWFIHFRNILGTRGPRRRYLLSWWISTLMTILLQQGSSLRSKPPWDKGKSAGPNPCLSEDHWRGEEEHPNSSVVLHQLQKGIRLCTQRKDDENHVHRNESQSDNARHISEEFNIQIGVLPWDTLAPLPFS